MGSIRGIVKEITFETEGLMETTKTLDPEEAERPMFGPAFGAIPGIISIARIIRANTGSDVTMTDTSNNEIITLM